MTPDDFNAQLALAQEALNGNDLAAAKAIYEALIRDDSANLLPYVGLGQIAYQKGYLDDADALFEESCELGLEAHDGVLPKKLPWNPANEPLLRAIHGRGMVAYRRNDADAAKQWFSLLLQLNPSDEQGARYFVDAIANGKRWAEMG